MSSIECLAKASELDAIARQCTRKTDRDAFTETAEGWRRTAFLARQQEARNALVSPH